MRPANPNVSMTHATEDRAANTRSSGTLRIKAAADTTASNRPVPSPYLNALAEYCTSRSVPSGNLKRSRVQADSHPTSNDSARSTLKMVQSRTAILASEPENAIARRMIAPPQTIAKRSTNNRMLSCCPALTPLRRPHRLWQSCDRSDAGWPCPWSERSFDRIRPPAWLWRLPASAGLETWRHRSLSRSLPLPYFHSIPLPTH